MNSTKYSEYSKRELEQMKLLLEMYEKLKDNETFQAFFEDKKRINLEKQQI
ncbi:hypothetical protein RGU76_08080 [Bacillus pseudomycoides]|uniref:hypothetical protein n=1 Tax=Bacillus TaxID=1386 RepID=UPI0022496ED7|nr:MULTISPECIES: hypothetical protein [Bacillus]MCX2828358.1 hypothetical protein [Bacillus sp. DHT2]MDR4915054.1 hypothetical protein [Bacillus pseudomycoides]